MIPGLLDTLAALGLAFGSAAFTTLCVRSERFPTLIVGSFVTTFIVLLATLLWANLPAGLSASLGGAGVLLGVFSTAGIMAAKRVDRMAEA